MGKEKKRSIDENEKKETLFYYELIGITFIIFSITILGRLGKVGSFLTVFFQVAFGDWYWIFVVFLLFFGFMNLFKHKSFDFKNQRFIGFLFITFGLLIFAHFPLHNFIQENSDTYFKTTWNHYQSFINADSSNFYLGGGIVGSIAFYAIYYLFGSVGVILIGLLIMMLGLSLIINMPIIEIFKTIGRFAKKFTTYTGNFNRFFKYKIGTNYKTDVEKSIFSKQQQVPLKILEEFQNVMNYNFQEKVCIETRSLIHSVFSNLHIEYRDIDFIISYKVTTYKFTIFSEYDTKLLIERLNNVIEEDILIGQDGSNLMVQIVNKYPQILTTRELLMKQSSLYNNFLLPIGLTYENKICEVDISKNGNILLIGSDNSGIKNFINYYLLSLFVKENLINYDIEIFDHKNELYHLNKIIKASAEKDVNAYLNNSIAEIDRRLETIGKSGVSTIDEYNKKLEIDGSNINQLKRKFIIINRLDCDKETYSYFENKLMYVTQLGEKAGVSVLYTIRDELYITSIILSLFANKLVFKLDTSYFSNKVMNNDNASFLQSLGDCFFLSQVKARRLQTPLVSKKDIQSVIEYLN